MALRTKKSENILPFALRGARKSYRSHQKENRTVGREYFFFEDKQRENHSDQRREERGERREREREHSGYFFSKLENVGIWVFRKTAKFWYLGFLFQILGIWVFDFRLWVFGELKIWHFIWRRG